MIHGVRGAHHRVGSRGHAEVITAAMRGSIVDVDERWTVSGTVQWRSRRVVGSPDATAQPTQIETRVSPVNTWIQIIDLDRFRHDLISEGAPREDGSFTTSFGRSEFNLDRFENEDWPDLWVVIARRTDAGPIPIESFGLPRHRWNGRSADLGSIDLDPHLFQLPGSEDVPSASAGTRDRVDLDADLARTLAAGVAPEVERLTGWPIALDNLSFDITDRFADHFAEYLDDVAATFIDPEQWWFRAAANLVANDFVTALYVPQTNTIAINEGCSELPSDSIQVVVGHELVHAAQFANIPNLTERITVAFGDLIETIDLARHDAAELESTITNSEIHRIMTALEGQAVWVQAQLARERSLAPTPTVRPSIIGRLLRVVAARVGLDGIAQSKVSQYQQGFIEASELARLNGSSLPDWLTKG